MESETTAIDNVRPVAPRIVVVAIALVILLGAAVFFYESVYSPLPHRDSLDFVIYYEAAAAAREGLNPFEKVNLEHELKKAGLPVADNPYLYPSVFLVFVRPLLRLTVENADLVFQCVSLLALAGGMYLLFRLMKTCRHLSHFPPWLMIGITLWFTPIWSNLYMNQINLFVFVALMVFLYLSVHRHDFLAGNALGLAVMLKVSPVVLLAYVLVRKKWSSLVGFLAMIAVLETLSGLVFGGLLDTHLPAAISARNHVLIVINPPTDFGSWSNFAIPAVLAGMIGRFDASVLIALTILGVVVGLPSLYVTWIHRRSKLQLRYILVCLLITVSIIFETITWNHHLVHLITPFLILAAILTSPVAPIKRRNRFYAIAALVLAFILVELDYWRVWNFLDMYSWPAWMHPAVWGMLLLWSLQMVLLLASGVNWKPLAGFSLAARN